MSNLSNIDQYYIPQIISLIGSIPFDTGTLASILGGKLLTPYDQAIKDTPFTQINVYADSLASNYFESKLNKRKYIVKIKIYTYTINRQLQSQQDLNYLEEQVIQVLENNLEALNAPSGFTYSDNEGIQSQSKSYYENFLTKEITWSVYKQVVVNN